MLVHSDDSDYATRHSPSAAACTTTPTAAAASSAASRATTRDTTKQYADPEVVAMASSSAAVLTKAALHPLDTLKCRVQLLRTDELPPHASCSTWRGLAHTRLRQLRHQYAGQWRPRYLYGGLPIKLFFYVPYQAMYLSSYNFAQRTLQHGVADELDGEGHRSSSYVWHTVAAAVFAEVATCALRVPMETMKMRVQSAATRGSVQAMVQLCRQGMRANLRLLVPHTLMHDIPYSVIQWVVYETLRPWTQQWGARLAAKKAAQADRHGGDGASAGSSDSFLSRYGAELARTFFSGGFSGLIASTLTVPLDNIRTRTAVATASDPKLTVCRVVKVAYRREGLRGFVRGGGMRVVWVTTNMACFYPLFEGIRSVLQARADAAKGQA